MVNIVKMCALTNQDIFLKSLKTLLFCLRDFRLKSSYYLFFTIANKSTAEGLDISKSS